MGRVRLRWAPAGPITPLDILYGHRPPLARGNPDCHCERSVAIQGVMDRHATLAMTKMVAARRRAHPYYDLWALGTVAPMGEAELRELATGHFPG